MKYTQRAIELAVEGGYHPNTVTLGYTDKSLIQDILLFKEETFLDPLFWQSLGKVLGWKEHMLYRLSNSVYEEALLPKEGTEWRIQMHRFIDALASGQTPDDFFATILPADK